MPSPHAYGEGGRPQRLYILNIHGIGIPSPELSATEKPLWIEKSKFQAILDCVRDHRNIRLTFDDANESDCSIALPELEARNLHAHFFIVAGRLGQPGYLSPAQVESLIAGGMTIGNHGLYHRRWAGLNQPALHEELVEARDRLEQVARKSIDAASCPFGNYNRRIIKKARAAGYRSFYTSDGGPAWENAFVLPRTSLNGAQDFEAIQGLIQDAPGRPLQLWRQVKRLIKQWR